MFCANQNSNVFFPLKTFVDVPTVFIFMSEIVSTSKLYKINIVINLKEIAWNSKFQSKWSFFTFCFIYIRKTNKETEAEATSITSWSISGLPIFVSLWSSQFRRYFVVSECSFWHNVPGLKKLSKSVFVKSGQEYLKLEMPYKYIEW